MSFRRAAAHQILNACSESESRVKLFCAPGNMNSYILDGNALDIEPLKASFADVKHLIPLSLPRTLISVPTRDATLKCPKQKKASAPLGAPRLFKCF